MFIKFVVVVGSGGWLALFGWLPCLSEFTNLIVVTDTYARPAIKPTATTTTTENSARTHTERSERNEHELCARLRWPAGLMACLRTLEYARRQMDEFPNGIARV